MDEDLANKINALPALNKAQLLVIWRDNFSKSPPPILRKELMVPILAYRMQEKEHGGLSHSARKRLREIARLISAEKRPREPYAALRGELTIGEIVKGTPGSIWDRFGDRAGCTHEEFNAYIGECGEVCAIELSGLRLYLAPVGLHI